MINASSRKFLVSFSRCFVVVRLFHSDTRECTFLEGCWESTLAKSRKFPLSRSLSFSRTTSKNEHAYHDRVFPQILLSVCEETSLFRVVFFSRIATVIFYIEIILISPIASHKIKSNTIGCWVELQSFKIKLKFAQKPSREDFKVILKCKVLKIFTSLECNCYVLQEMHFI